MRAHRRRAGMAPGHSGESGYAYLMVLFLMMAMLIGSQVVLSNLATQGRRQRERETIWRGNQYIRAVRLYYRKTGHYPQSVDDLQKGLPGLHFLRIEAYNDPMNKDDGAWRLIYVNAAGQIIGSVRYATLQQMALLDLNGGVMPTGQQGNATASAGQSDSSSDSSQATAPQPTAAQAPQQGGQFGQPLGLQAAPGMGASPFSSQISTGSSAFGQGTSPFGSSNPALSALAQLKPTGPVDGPVLGGFITGVASKIDSPSIKVYKGGKTYQQWEFIWNPLEDQARAMQSGLSPQGQQPGVGLPIANPFGGTSNAPANPGANPPGGNGPEGQPPQSPLPAPPQNPPDQPLMQQ